MRLGATHARVLVGAYRHAVIRRCVRRGSGGACVLRRWGAVIRHSMAVITGRAVPVDGTKTRLVRAHIAGTQTAAVDSDAAPMAHSSDPTLVVYTQRVKRGRTHPRPALVVSVRPCCSTSRNHHHHHPRCQAYWQLCCNTCPPNTGKEHAVQTNAIVLAHPCNTECGMLNAA